MDYWWAWLILVAVALLAYINRRIVSLWETVMMVSTERHREMVEVRRRVEKIEAQLADTESPIEKA